MGGWGTTLVGGVCFCCAGFRSGWVLCAVCLRLGLLDIPAFFQERCKSGDVWKNGEDREPSYDALELLVVREERIKAVPIIAIATQ